MVQSRSNGRAREASTGARSTLPGVLSTDPTRRTVRVATSRVAFRCTGVPRRADEAREMWWYGSWAHRRPTPHGKRGPTPEGRRRRARIRRGAPSSRPAAERCFPPAPDQAPGPVAPKGQGMGVQPERRCAVFLRICVRDTRTRAVYGASTSRTACPRSPPHGLAGSQTGFELDDRAAYGGVWLRNHASVGS